MLIKIHNPCVIETKIADFFLPGKRFVLFHEVFNPALCLLLHRKIHLHIHKTNSYSLVPDPFKPTVQNKFLISTDVHHPCFSISFLMMTRIQFLFSSERHRQQRIYMYWMWHEGWSSVMFFRLQWFTLSS